MNGVMVRAEWRADTGWSVSVAGRLERADELWDVITQIKTLAILLPMEQPEVYDALAEDDDLLEENLAAIAMETRRAETPQSDSAA